MTAESADPELTPEELECLLHDEVDVASAPMPSPATASPAFEPPAFASPAPLSPTPASLSMPQFPTQAELAIDDAPAADDESVAVVPDEALAVLEEFTRDFAEQISVAFHERLNLAVATEVTGTAQTTLRQFVGEMAQPTCLQIVNASPLSQPVYWEWSPQILFPLLDHLLGGGALPPTIARRPLTDIEQRLVTNTSNQLLEVLAHTWERALTLTPQLDRIESNPRSLEELDDMPLWAAEIQIEVGSHEGPLRIAYDMNSIAEVSESLIESRRKPKTHAEVSVVLAESRLNENELMELRVGDIISTDSDGNDNAMIFVDDELTFHGVPGAKSGRKAVRIAEHADIGR